MTGTDRQALPSARRSALPSALASARRSALPGACPSARRTQRRGSALVLALAVLLLAHALAAAVAIRVAQGAQQTSRRIERTKAFEAAEAGLADAVQRLRRGDPSSIPRQRVGDDASVAVEERTLTSLPLERTVALEARGQHGRSVETVVLTLRVIVPPAGHGIARLERLAWRRLPPERR